MVRFRLGQVWKREGLSKPLDAFGLELDGVDLLSGASEEPLDRVVADLLEALEALALDGARSAELSLPEAHLELLFRRLEDDLELRVVRLSRPAGVVRGPLLVDLADVVDAAVRCGQTLLRDVADTAEVSPELRRAISERLVRLEHTVLASPPEAGVPGGFSVQTVAPGSVAFAFELDDPEDLILSWTDGPGALTSLLCGGAVALRVDGRQLWRAEGVPFLLALELSRQGNDLLHAIELGERTFDFSPGGADGELSLHLPSAVLQAKATDATVTAEALARAMFELGTTLALAVIGRNRAQAKNPWLSGIVERCREGLARLGTGVSPPKTEAPATARSRPAAATKRPLRSHGKLRRLRFERLWDKQNLGNEGGGALLLGRRGPTVATPHLATGFTATGAVRFRHVGAQGVAVDADGRAVVATVDRVFGFRANSQDAVWLRDHDGMSLGPRLYARDQVWVSEAQGRGVVGFSELTGRELWRFVPPRTQRTWVTVHGHRVLVAADTGQLFGLELEDGTSRYRLRSSHPFGGPVSVWGRRLIAVGGRGARSSITVADVHTGAVLWTHELSVSRPSAPLALSRRIYVAGAADGAGLLTCLGQNGNVLWERRLHLGEAPWSLTAIGHNVLVTARTGAAVLFSPEGDPEWRVGAAGAELPSTIAPLLARDVLFLPGELTRAVDPRGGRVLAEVRTGIGLCDLDVDARLNLYALDEDGTLVAFRLSATFAVVQE